MKKLTALLLLVALVCSLCVFAPSAAALSEEEEALYTKYADLIALLEAEEYDTAMDTIWGMMPAAEYEEVVLTPENLFDYYDLVNDEPYIERDSTGAITYIWPGNLLLRIKEEYQGRIDFEQSMVTVGVTAKRTLYRAKVDWETGEITLGDKIDSDLRKQMKKSGLFEPTLDTSESGNYSIYLGGDGFYFKHPEYKTWWRSSLTPDLKKAKAYVAEFSDLEVVRVEGSLFVSK